MKTSFISNIGVQTSMRNTISSAQAQLIKAQKEIATGTFADRGVSLGWETGRSINLSTDVNRIQTLMDSNAIVDDRLQGSQAAMTSIEGNMQTVRDALLALSGSQDQTLLKTAVQTTTNAIESFIAAGNTSANGEYLFAGINTDVKPLADYDAASAAKATFDSNFTTFFGFPPTSTQVNTITAAQMDTFITGTLEPLYTGAQWNTDWSTASDTNMQTRISTAETVTTSTNANEDGFRMFALGGVIAKELLALDIGADVRQVVSENAISYINAGITGINAQRTAIGLSQERLSAANDTLSSQKNIIESSFKKLIEVDAYEASTLVNALKTQVETSYTLTARIQQLSLVNYL
ncbi:flagellar hook-associated family protein [Rhizobium sp. L1K21]|uniref:flagellar hook-associated family protein n=1 Tax=Rhizobium sp. L1K21 TaxID=2954933 RepID=UPI0020929A8D|nr:flagellar hook-associated family protein [Rhizobium sp. L1K21]MCO6187106.1 flagellar hook-associated family protein [Rhizobium sp. L1K21]